MSKSRDIKKDVKKKPAKTAKEKKKEKQEKKKQTFGVKEYPVFRLQKIQPS